MVESPRRCNALTKSRRAASRDLLAKPVIDAANRLDLLGAAPELLPQRFDVCVNRSFENEGVVPHRLFHQFVAAEGPSELADKGPQQEEFGRHEIQPPSHSLKYKMADHNRRNSVGMRFKAARRK